MRILTIFFVLLTVSLAFGSQNVMQKKNFTMDNHIDSKIEINTDRPGNDYKNFNLPFPDYNLCMQECEKDPKCKAWTYVKPNSGQGLYPRCWLKYNIPTPIKNNCCISGIKNVTNKANISKNNINTESWFKNWEIIQLPTAPNGKIGVIAGSNETFGWKKPVRKLGDAMPPSGAKGAALYLHPISPNKPTILKGKYFVNSKEKLLMFRVAGNINGDFLLEVKINGIKALERVVNGKKWYELTIPLQQYYGKNIDVEMLIKANGWYYEYAFIDEIKLIDNPYINVNNNSSEDKEKIDLNYLGCFKDAGDPAGLRGRDLGAWWFSSANMTPQLCIQECGKRGYIYSGVQYGSQCFCDNNYGMYGPANNCNMKCSGDTSKICGGVWANDVYKTDTQHINNTPQQSSIIYKISECAAYQNSDNYLNKSIPEFLNKTISKIFITCKVKNIPINTVLTAQWYYIQPDGEKMFIINYPFEIKQVNYTGYLTYHLEMPSDKLWPPGNYEVIITNNGTQLKTITFKVR
ncbi:WSC domain-containing protein [Deferribacter abyssi]|uniref:WSC domain-containing protein n=1 Tax=Deferribacter abyssi TaxID=213806 RepID=UPI003C292902